MEVHPVVHYAGKVSRLHTLQNTFQEQQEEEGGYLAGFDAGRPAGITGVRFDDGGKKQGTTFFANCKANVANFNLLTSLVFHDQVRNEESLTMLCFPHDRVITKVGPRT